MWEAYSVPRIAAPVSARERIMIDSKAAFSKKWQEWERKETETMEMFFASDLYVIHRFDETPRTGTKVYPTVLTPNEEVRRADTPVEVRNLELRDVKLIAEMWKSVCQLFERNIVMETWDISPELGFRIEESSMFLLFMAVAKKTTTMAIVVEKSG